MQNHKTINIGFYILTGVLLLLRCLYPVYAQLFNPDKLEQIVATHNWLAGNGITRFWITSELPGLPVAEALIQWPPGYSYVLGTLMFFGLSLFQSLVVIDIVVIIILAWAAWFWIQNMNIHAGWIAIMLWGTFIFNTNLIQYTTTVDMMCFALFFSALTMLYRPMINYSITLGLTAGLLLGFTFWVRYAYLPQVLALLAVGTAYDYLYLRERFKKLWLPALLGCGVLLIAYFLRDTLKNPGFIDESARSFYLENLKRFNWNVLGEIFVGTNGLQRFLLRFGDSAEFLIGIFMSLAVGMIFIITFKKKKNEIIPTFVLLSVGVVNVGMLVYLSLTNAPQTWTANGWTFVEAHRYYAPTWAVLWLCMISAIPLLLQFKVTKWILIGASLITILDFGYYSKWKLTGTALLERPGMHQLPNYNRLKILALETKQNGRIPVYTSKDPTQGLIAEVAGWIPLKDDILNYPLDTQIVTVLAIQYPLEQLPKGTNWQEKNLDSGTSLYLTHK